jgi:hypothetical protein
MEIDEKFTEEFENDKLVKYDAVCYTTLISIYAKTHTVAAEKHVIPFKNFNFNDPEHLFVLAVARGLSTIVESQISIKTNPIRFWRENRKIKVEGSKLAKYKKEYDDFAITPEEILADVFSKHEDWFFCDDGIEFADIYNEYYA